jgi:hypothetical protein
VSSSEFGKHAVVHGWALTLVARLLRRLKSTIRLLSAKPFTSDMMPMIREVFASYVTVHPWSRGPVQLAETCRCIQLPSRTPRIAPGRADDFDLLPRSTAQMEAAITARVGLASALTLDIKCYLVPFEQEDPDICLLNKQKVSPPQSSRAAPPRGQVSHHIRARLLSEREYREVFADDWIGAHWSGGSTNPRFAYSTCARMPTPVIEWIRDVASCSSPPSD